MAEITIAAAMVKSKANADDWFTKMGAAADAAKRTMLLKNYIYDSEPNWTKIRRESQKLLYLRYDYLSIVEELKKVENTFDLYNSKSEHLKMSISLLEESVNLLKRGKARCSKTFEIKLRKKQIEVESIKNEITITKHSPPDQEIKAQKELESKKASLEEKIRCYPEREANEPSSFDSKIRESEEKLREKMTKLETVEPNLVVAGETLKKLKHALHCCEEAIPMLNLVFVHRLRKFNADFDCVRVDEVADVGIIKHIYVMRDLFRGFQLNFVVYYALDFCKEISNIYRGIIDFELGRPYKLSIDEGGLFHIRKLTPKEADAVHLP